MAIAVATLCLSISTLATLGCGSPRPLELSEGPPAFPLRLFDGTLPEPSLIGTSRSRLEADRPLLGRVRRDDASTGAEETRIEFFSANPYVLSVSYSLPTATPGEIGGDGAIGTPGTAGPSTATSELRVSRMRYELHPQVTADLGLRLSLYGELLAHYGVPTESDAARQWDVGPYRLVWHGATIVVTRRR